VLLVVLGCASRLATPRDRALKAGAAPACVPGTLLFSASQAPRALALSPDGNVVAVADRGALVLRDAATLAPIRYLLPTLDHWQEVAFSPDGHTLRARTVDGLRFRIDIATGKAERLLNDEHASHEALTDDEIGFTRWFLGRAAQMEEDQRAFWRNPTPALRLPSLPPGSEATAVAIGRLVPAPGGGRLESLTEVEAPAEGEGGRFYIAGSDGRIRAFDMADKPLAEGALPPGARVVHIGIGGGHVLAALNDGGVAIYDRSLVLERRVRVLDQPNAPPPRDPAGMTDYALGATRAWPAHALASLDYDPARRRLVWASSGHELGVLDVGSERTLAVLPGTASVGGVDRMAFLGARTIVAVAAGRLWAWDPYDGRRVDRAGGYRAFTSLGPSRILAVRFDGHADLIDLDGERFRFDLRRTICVLADNCRERERWDEHGRPSQPPELDVAISPDGREVAVFEFPLLQPTGDGDYKGRLAVLSAETFAPLRSVEFDGCKDDSSLWFGARQIAACGTRHDRTTLAALPDDAGRFDRPRPKPGTNGLFDFVAPNGWPTALGAAAAIGITKMLGDYESIATANARGELTAVLAAPATRDGSGMQISDRAQLRAASMVEPSPDGSRFLIASRGLNGALQLWCTPTTGGIDGYPAEPARPDVMEIDGITEIAVADFPGYVIDAIEAPEGLLILGVRALPTDAPGQAIRGLWTYDPAARKVARLEIPTVPAPSDESESWDRFETDPGGTSIWLFGKHHIARRETDGAWSVFVLPPGTTNQVAVIGDKLAVHVGTRLCNDAKPCRPGLLPFCYDLTLVGAVPAGAAVTRTFDSCVGAVAPIPGGFVALGGAEVGFRDGAWVGPRDPLVAAAGRAHASDGFGRGDELVLAVDLTHLLVLGLADGRSRRTIALPFSGRPSPIAPVPGHAASIWLAPNPGAGAMVDLGPSGEATVYGSGPAPAWSIGGSLRPRGGHALWWYGGTALIGFDGKHWTAVFNPLERTKLLVSRRVGY
jgi:hypothetical protein